jgi:DNA repair photolyase
MSADPTLAALQRAPGAPDPAAPASLPLRVDRVRTFDTPEFAGITFLEVESKTALNRVSGMPFGWSINPYRGCSHACSYCLRGETPVLLADGRTRPIGELRPGDAVYGTRVRDGVRRYAVTEVLDHWSTVKPAYRVVLADGTDLVTSGDHRFLTPHGWRHVAAAGAGAPHRPILTAASALVGTGRVVPSPKHTADYQRGYLGGLLRGDAPTLRPATAAPEALARAGAFLAHQGVELAGPLTAAALAGRADVADLAAWPDDPSGAWCRGFLAAVFDADGSARDGVLRIAIAEFALVRVLAVLGRFRFDLALEGARSGEPLVVRLRGGVRDHLRFLHLTDPAVTRTATIADRPVRSDPSLRVVAVEPLGLELPLYDITTGTGDFLADGVVSHNCFARPTHAYLNLDPLGDFERTIVVKTNVAQVLRREVARRSWKGEHVAMGTNTDPYQRAEGRYRLMPGIIGALAEGRTPFSILTKGTLITRDIDVLRDAARHVPVAAAMTVGMLDDTVWRETEPGTPPPQARLSAVGRLNDAGIPTGVMLAPIMPGLNDDREQLAALVDAIAAAGATHITPIVLHLRPRVKEVFWPWLEEFHPELVDRYRALYRGAQAQASYRTPVEDFVKERRRDAWARHGLPPRPAAWRAQAPPGTDDPMRRQHRGPDPELLLGAPVAARRARGPVGPGGWRPRPTGPPPDPGEQLSLL